MKRWMRCVAVGVMVGVVGVVGVVALMAGGGAVGWAAEPGAAPAGAGAKEVGGMAPRADYLAGLRDQLQREWPRNRTITIVCHGHSVPAGYFKTPVVQTMDAYPHLLHEGIVKAFPHAVTNVIVTAIGGENAQQGAARFEKDVLALRPDVVTIDYALNDRGIGLAAAKKAWSEMIEKAQAAGVKVILLTPTGDTSAKLEDANDPLNQHARQIRELAAQYHVGLVDSLELIKTHIRDGGKLEELMSQVNHPNRKGHEMVAGELARWWTGK